MKYIKLGHGVSRVFFLRNHPNARNFATSFFLFCDRLLCGCRTLSQEFVAKKNCAIFCEEQKSVANFYFVCERKYS